MDYILIFTFLASNLIMTSLTCPYTYTLLKSLAEHLSGLSLLLGLRFFISWLLEQFVRVLLFFGHRVSSPYSFLRIPILSEQ